MEKQEALYPPLIEHKVDAALVDINSLKDVVHKLEKKHNIRVSGILLKETFYGMVLREKADNLTACFQEYIEKYEHSIFRKMSEYSGTQKVELNSIVNCVNLLVQPIRYWQVSDTNHDSLL